MSRNLNALHINQQADLLVYRYTQETGLSAVHNIVLGRVQFEHPQPGVSHPKAWLSVPVQQFVDNFDVYVSGQLPE